MLRLYTFGGLRVERDGQPLHLPTQKARELIAYLVTFRDRSHPRAVVAGTLWPDLPEDRARRRLSDTLWRVRQVLDDCVAADEASIWHNRDSPCWLDVEQLQDAIANLDFEIQDPQRIQETLDLYQGPYLDGLYLDWVLLERERLQGCYLEALDALLTAYKQRGDYRAALQVTQQLVATEPLHEAAHRELMRLYHLLGRDAEAIAQYRQCEELLRQELGVAPAPETRAVYEALVHRATADTGPTAVHLPTRARRPPIDLDELPLAGRDVERGALLDYLEAAAAGQGSVVLLEGEAGIGKTRLAREVVAGARWRNISAVMVGTQESSTAPSFGLVRAAIASSLTPLRVRQLAYMLDPADLGMLALILPEIAQGSSTPSSADALSPPQARERIQQALVGTLLALSQISPYLWVLDDVQWADAETLAFLPLLAPHLSESRTLLLLVARSTELRANPAAWDALQALDRTWRVNRYVLARLDVDALNRLVRDLLGQESASLAQGLTLGSEGVPLYVAETLKAWRDEGMLVPGESGNWRWQGEAAAVPPIGTGRAVIQRRLARLTPTAARVLDAAAVIGTEVDYDLLAWVCADQASGHLLHGTDPGLLAATDQLLRQGLLIETDTGYCFSHERIRQAVYRRLSALERQRLHLCVGQAMETAFPEQFELLAYHYAAGGAREQAIRHLHSAVDRARALFAHQAALTCYARLLDLLTLPEDCAARYDVLFDRAEVLGWIGERKAQGDDVEEMLSLARALPDEARLARALHRRSEWHRIQGQYERAQDDALAALDIYRRLGDDRSTAGLLAQLGWNTLYTAGPTHAEAYLCEALPIYVSLADIPGQISCQSGLVAAAQYRGDYAVALDHLQQHVKLAEATGDPIRIGRALHNTGAVHYDLGDIETAERYMRQALEVKETTGDRRSQAITHISLGNLAGERGDLEAAQAHLETAAAICREVGDASWEGDAWAALGRVLLLLNEPRTAKSHLQLARQRRLELGEPAYAVIDLSYLALADLALGEEALAWDHSQEAVGELVGGLEGVEHPYRIHYNHSRVAAGTHRWSVARAALETAHTLMHEYAGRIGDPVLQQTYLTGRRANRAITTAAAALPRPGQLCVRLPRANAPARRRLTAEDTTEVIWTTDTGRADADLARQKGKVALRRHRLLRLLDEAEAAGARPTVADLAGALDVSPRTIRADLAALREKGYAVRTHGQRA
jgi:DNA-binding SARP family transcriptional activator/tetratricopeptide (TPR) repeat protein/DNA-binding transcriptional ArsR family regulator